MLKLFSAGAISPAPSSAAPSFSQPSGALLRRNVLIYGVGGVVAPFVGIKLIDVIIRYMHMV